MDKERGKREGQSVEREKSQGEKKREQTIKHVHVRRADAIMRYQSTSPALLNKILNSKPWPI